MVSVEMKKQVEWYAKNAAQQMKFANLAKCDEAMLEHSKNSFQYMQIACQINQDLAEKMYKKEMNSKK